MRNSMPDTRPKLEALTAGSRAVRKFRSLIVFITVAAIPATFLSYMAFAGHRTTSSRSMDSDMKDLIQRCAQLASSGAANSEVFPDPGWDPATLRELVQTLRREKASILKEQQPRGTVNSTDSSSATAVTGQLQRETAWKGYECSATEKDMKRYLNFTPRAACPNDWYFVQRLIFKKNCFALPRRRCLAVTPVHPKEPLARPHSYFSQRALKDENVRWDLHACKSFACLNKRKGGDCLQCFNLTKESKRFKKSRGGLISMAEVLSFKNGSIRIGLDIGGGTGSFAAHMALHGVTILTTAFNVETWGVTAGLPYMEAIAQRGLVPLHWPHKARLPFYDGVLDIIHSMHTIKYFSPMEFEELLYEWNRVLRTGGVLWFENFYAPEEVMPTYISIIERMGYKKLYWSCTPKLDGAEKEGPHLKLNSVLEKPPMPSNDFFTSPLEEDMAQILSAES